MISWLENINTISFGRLKVIILHPNKIAKSYPNPPALIKRYNIPREIITIGGADIYSVSVIIKDIIGDSIIFRAVNIYTE